jgi:hypothetical protein
MKKIVIIVVIGLIGYVSYLKFVNHSDANRASSLGSVITYDATNGLRGVVTDIPVFLPAKVTSRIEGGNLEGTIHAYTWFLQTPSKKEEVIAFNNRKLSHATKTSFDDGSAIWAFTPAGGSDAVGESATVLATAEGKIEIMESVLKDKRRTTLNSTRQP